MHAGQGLYEAGISKPKNGGFVSENSRLEWIFMGIDINPQITV